MPLRGRHSLNFYFFLVEHWAIIPIPVYIWGQGGGGVPQQGHPWGHTPSQDEMRRERQLEGLEVGGVTRVITHLATDSDGGGGGGPTSSVEASHFRPIVRGRPHKEFCKGGWRGPEGTGRGQWLSVRYASTRRVLSSSSASSPFHTCSVR